MTIRSKIDVIGKVLNEAAFGFILLAAVVFGAQQGLKWLEARRPVSDFVEFREVDMLDIPGVQGDNRVKLGAYEVAFDSYARLPHGAYKVSFNDVLECSFSGDGEYRSYSEQTGNFLNFPPKPDFEPPNRWAYAAVMPRAEVSCRVRTNVELTTDRGNTFYHEHMTDVFKFVKQLN